MNLVLTLKSSLEFHAFTKGLQAAPVSVFPDKGHSCSFACAKKTAPNIDTDENGPFQSNTSNDGFTIFNWKIHYKWWFSIVRLNYQRVGLHKPLTKYIKYSMQNILLPQRHLPKLRHSPWHPHTAVLGHDARGNPHQGRHLVAALLPGPRSPGVPGTGATEVAHTEL